MSEYQDFDGNPCSLHSLCIAEPEWAVNHIERLTADNAKLLAVIDKALDEEYIPNEWLQAALEGQEQDDGCNDL